MGKCDARPRQMGKIKKGAVMEKYQIEAYNNGDIAFTLVVETMEQVKQEVSDALHDGFQVLVTKFVLQNKGE